MCKDLRMAGGLRPVRLTLLLLLILTPLAWLALVRQESRAVEPISDPADGQVVRLIIRGRRGLELRVFAYTDQRESGTSIIQLDRYEMDQVFEP